MKQLIVKGLLFLFGCIALLHLMAYVSQTVAPDGTTTFLLIDQGHVNELLENASSAEAIVVGNSHGEDIDFEAMNEEGYQLARAWGDLFEAEYYLQALVPKLPNLQTVYLPVSYFTFYWDNAAAKNLNIRRQNMYGSVPSWRFIHGDFLNFIQGRGNQLVPITIVLREDNWRDVFYALLSRENSLQEKVQQPKPANECDIFQTAQLEEVSYSRAGQQIELAKEIAENNPDVKQDALESAKNIIEYLQNRNIRVVFFTPPYYQAYNEAYKNNDSDAIILLHNNMEKLQEEYGVEYYNFSSDPAFSTEESLFQDSDHLNDCGDLKFSEVLNRILFNEVAK